LTAQTIVPAQRCQETFNLYISKRPAWKFGLSYATIKDPQKLVGPDYHENRCQMRKQHTCFKNRWKAALGFSGI